MGIHALCVYWLQMDRFLARSWIKTPSRPVGNNKQVAIEAFHANKKTGFTQAERHESGVHEPKVSAKRHLQAVISPSNLSKHLVFSNQSDMFGTDQRRTVLKKALSRHQPASRSPIISIITNKSNRYSLPPDKTIVFQRISEIGLALELPEGYLPAIIRPAVAGLMRESNVSGRCSLP